MIPALIIATALAGPLADGYRGVTWGEYETFPAPTENCRKGNEPAIAWICNQTIGDIPVEVAYAYNHNIFYALVITGKNYLDCATLSDTLDAGWGPSTLDNEFVTGKMAKKTWRDRSVFAAWKYNEFSKVCDVYAIHNEWMQKMEKLEKAKAVKGVKDL